MRIDVTRGDIDAGVRYNGRMCPIRLAIKRTTRRRNVLVSRRMVRFSQRCVVWLPDEAVRFVDRFDTGQVVQPFSFDLPLEAR